MAKEMLNAYQIELLNNLHLSYNIEFSKPIYRLKKTTINRLLNINNISYAKVIKYNFTDAILTLQCYKSNEIYDINVYDNLEYCKCSKCKSDRRISIAKSIWDRPGYKDHQQDVQSKVWDQPGYRENQKSIQRETHSSNNYRQNMSNIMKDKFKDIKYRENNIIKNADRLRRYPAKDELTFINVLERYNINYAWQYPILLKEHLGFDVIMDFYLPDYDIFININTDNFHRDFQGVIDKDKKLVKFFGDKLCILEDLNEAEKLIKEVISQ